MSGFVRARIEDGLKRDATEVLEAIGLTVSDVVRMLLTRIAKEKALPVDLVVPNAKTIAAMEEGRTILDKGRDRFKTAQEMFSELESKPKKEGKGKATTTV
jgi:DNA-damage-inducible protein J